jgi:ribosomal protein S8
MSQDIVADTLNQMMNAKRAHKTTLQVKKHSKFLLAVLAIGKLKGYVKSYKTEGRNLDIEIGELLNACKAIKPRFEDIFLQEIWALLLCQQARAL